MDPSLDDVLNVKLDVVCRCRKTSWYLQVIPGTSGQRRHKETDGLVLFHTQSTFR